MSKVAFFIQKEEVRHGFVIEEEACCAGLTGICLGWGDPACPGVTLKSHREG